MQTDAIGSAATVTGKPAGSTAALAENFDTFLKLLTTQLQNQDPLEPLDTHQFTQQLVQFSGVEQQIRTNQQLEGLSSLLGNGALQQGVGYIGRDVTAATATGSLTDGQAAWTYAFADAVTKPTLTITDAAGKLVYAAPATGTAGPQDFVWDGRDGAGTALPDGAYVLDVIGRNAADEVVRADVSSRGRVTGVEVRDGATLLMLGSAGVPIDKVTSVHAAGG